jgi:hypothetical protein
MADGLKFNPLKSSGALVIVIWFLYTGSCYYPPSILTLFKKVFGWHHT